jgi:hypothetical protein
MKTQLWLVACVVMLGALAGCEPGGSDDGSQADSGVRESSESSGVSRTFGERQLEQMLADRPEMQNLLPEDHPVYRWLVASFEGDRTGSRIYWLADEPRSGKAAEHAAAYYGYPAYIVIEAAARKTPLDKWTMLVFEMFNIENTKSFKELLNLALEGKLDGESYARKCVQLEFDAAAKLRDFFRKTPLPNTTPETAPMYCWVTAEDVNFEECEKLWATMELYYEDSNYRHFKKQYDDAIAPLVRTGDIGAKK